MAKKSKSKCRYKPGRNFFSFPNVLTTHPDYFNMSYAAQSLLHAICARYNGFNNGDISIPISEMELIGWNPATLNRAKNELLTNNWIYRTRQGGKGKHFTCCLFAISFVPLDDIGNKSDAKFKHGYVAREYKKA